MHGRLSPFVDAIPEHLIETAETAVMGTSGGYLSRRAPRDQSRSRDEDDSGPGPEDGYDVDAAFNQDLPRFLKGENVVHETFGSGTVGEVSGFGRDLRVTVHFETVGSKKLLVRYAGLTRDFD